MQNYYQNSSTSSNRFMNFGLSRHQSVSNSYAQEDNIPTTQRNFLNYYNQNADISQNQLHTTNNNIYANLRNNANNLSISQAYQTDRFGREIFGQYVRRSGRKNHDNSNEEEDYSDEENRNQQVNIRQQRSRNRVNQQDSIHQQLHQQQQQLFQNSPQQEQKLQRNQLANIFNNNDLNYNVADLINKNEQEKDEAAQKQEEENLEKIKSSPYYIDANLIMKSTCFNQISFQIFFLFYLSNVLWNFNALYNFLFLWFVDVVQFAMTYKRISLNKLFLETYQNQKQKLSYGLLEYLEIIYFIIFKIILFIRLYFIKFDFFYIPLVFLIYVSSRATYIMRKKVKQNQSILTDIFIWTFKIFLSVQILLISLKFENQINWKWRDVFWAYWVFFSIMVGINIGFIIILFSKCYSKCSEDDVEIYELKGLFWLFILSNSLTVNITIYITSLISYYDDGDKQGVYFGFQYGLAFTVFLTVYSMSSRESIYLFLFKITKDDELSQENINLQNEINENYQNQSNSRQQQQDMSQNNRRRNQNQDDVQDQEVEESQDESSNQSQRQQNIQNENVANPQNTKQQKKIKIVKQQELNTGFPLILQKLSSTYFKIFKAVSQGSRNSISKQNNKKKQPQPSKEEIQKNIIINCKSHSFVSPREVLSQNNFNFKDLNQELRLQLSTKRSRVLQTKMELSTRSVAKSILLPLQDPQLKKMAQDTDKKYQNFLQSEKGVEIQKIIYEQNLNQEVNDNQKNINFSLEEIPKQHFNIDGPVNDSQIQKDQQGEQSNIESNNQDITLKSHNNNKNENQSNYQSQQSSNVIHDETNKSNNITKTGKNIKQYTCDQDNLQVTKQENSIGNTCVVCFDKTPDTLYMPCGHGGLCYDCAIDILKKTGECYLCRVEITEIYQLDIKQKKGKNYKVLAITQVLEDVSNLSQSQNENRNTNQMIPFEQINQQLQERLQQLPQQNEMMSASFHMGRQVNSPSNNNTANRNFVFQQGAQQTQIGQLIQIEQIQLQNNGNFQISDKYLAEDIEKSFQDQYKLPNTLNIHQNYFIQNEEIQFESNQNNVILDQLNGQILMRPTQTSSQSPQNLKDNASNFLIKFDSIEENTLKKEQPEQQENEDFEICSSNESPQLNMNLFTQNLQQKNSTLLNQIKTQQDQFLIPQNQSNETMQVQEDETNTTEKSVQNIQNKENLIKNSTKNNTLAEAPLNQIQKSSQEEEIQLPTENS
ncbi:zinc finger, C3HC4 type (RING finger) protein (macronuclear) [Tetrahymena thermophila SB210]|uniref:Zinc finger, C3HC4 type (RING finger) protein n=1 Tax=Tetrahymena thermophila (strain SB210) TaxID=312017 RepID=I7MLJ3_TETTS|nr:zinc finger, C3HC4 type (RING finger) protein [Tetrahymena thermophila SB210]EAS02404.2 zinc finger, C3HC4 type (RING finger) protein [Tetrahymena thermophila SB210]|eukprot:XP_001022649.2 zinc finger, C3HC4 type (RING finger) protein [Tetrahymena thermophila SB210]